MTVRCYRELKKITIHQWKKWKQKCWCENSVRVCVIVFLLSHKQAYSCAISVLRYMCRLVKVNRAWTKDPPLICMICHKVLQLCNCTTNTLSMSSKLTDIPFQFDNHIKFNGWHSICTVAIEYSTTSFHPSWISIRFGLTVSYISHGKTHNVCAMRKLDVCSNMSHRLQVEIPFWAWFQAKNVLLKGRNCYNVRSDDASLNHICYLTLNGVR